MRKSSSMSTFKRCGLVHCMCWNWSTLNHQSNITTVDYSVYLPDVQKLINYSTTKLLLNESTTMLVIIQLSESSQFQCLDSKYSLVSVVFNERRSLRFIKISLHFGLFSEMLRTKLGTIISLYWCIFWTVSFKYCNVLILNKKVEIVVYLSW